MKTETIAKSKIGKPFVRFMAKAMESRFRYRFFSPVKILQGVKDLQGKTVLEIGCGTGFFTIPAARIIGDQGNLLAMDILPESVEFVSMKVMDAGLQNVQVTKGDALNTSLDTGSFDTIILFGVIPAPMLPLTPILTEMHRILKPAGILAIWPPFPGLFPYSILRTGLFSLEEKRNGVLNFMRSE